MRRAIFGLSKYYQYKANLMPEYFLLKDLLRKSSEI